LLKIIWAWRTMKLGVTFPAWGAPLQNVGLRRSGKKVSAKIGILWPKREALCLECVSYEII
jgi:hypothetical protein